MKKRNGVDYESLFIKKKFLFFLTIFSQIEPIFPIGAQTISSLQKEYKKIVIIFLIPCFNF